MQQVRKKIREGSGIPKFLRKTHEIPEIPNQSGIAITTHKEQNNSGLFAAKTRVATPWIKHHYFWKKLDLFWKNLGFFMKLPPILLQRNLTLGFLAFYCYNVQ